MENSYTDQDVAEKLEKFVSSKFPNWSEAAIAKALATSVPNLRYYLGRDKKEKTGDRKIPAPLILNLILRFPDGEALFLRDADQVEPMLSEEKTEVLRELKQLLAELDDRQFELLKLQVEQFRQILLLQAGRKKREK